MYSDYLGEKADDEAVEGGGAQQISQVDKADDKAEKIGQVDKADNEAAGLDKMRRDTGL